MIFRHFRVFLLASLVFLLTVGPTLAEPDQQSQDKGLAPPRALAPVLLVDGGDTEEANAWYHAFMDGMFGVGNWDLYDMPSQGLPYPPELFHGVLGQYEGVLWHMNNSGNSDLSAAASYLLDYITPLYPESGAGRLLLVAAGLYNAFPSQLAVNGLGLFPQTAPGTTFSIPATMTAFTFMEDLQNLTATTDLQFATGLQPMAETEILYQMEYCTCYDRRGPPEPFVGVRYPDRQTSPLARAVTLGLPMHLYGGNGVRALETILKFHLGFIPTEEFSSGAGKARLAINNSGYLGSFYQSSDRPSLVYPYPGYVEHLFQGGIWVGARTHTGEVCVSTSSDHYGMGDESLNLREFGPSGEGVVVTSNIPGSEFYEPDAVAPWQLQCSFNDYVDPAGGDHIPLGIQVDLLAMSWNEYPIDDGVVLEYSVINISAFDLEDVYFGLFLDTNVGNTQRNSPYYPNEPGIRYWDWHDDLNGGWRPGDLAGDPDIWMMWEHDDDGDDGLATSWVGARLLSSSHTMTPQTGIPPVSYNAWSFRRGPAEDGFYTDPDTTVMIPGRYQEMSNGHFDVGVTPDGDFSVAGNWLGLLSTGPVASLAAGDTLRVTYAVVLGKDEWNLMRNSRQFALLEANDYLLDVSSTPEPSRVEAQLFPAAPNPFNAHTEISFSLAQSGWTSLEIFSADGRKVAVLVDGLKEAGDHRATWNGRDRSGRMMASGLYLHRLTTEDGERHVGHMTLVK